MRFAVAAVAAALLGVLVTAVPAEAHTTLTSSSPAKGATVTSPAQIRLTFADPVRFTGVVVEDAKGGHHESGKARAVDNHVTQPVAGVLAPGVYTVGWRVVAPDGHPVTGEYTFTVKGGGGAASPAPSSSAAAPSAGPATTPAAESSKPASSAGWWWIGLGILVVALAGGGLALVRRRG
jgi:methionine-rich copper-binding protein CopC